MTKHLRHWLVMSLLWPLTFGAPALAKTPGQWQAFGYLPTGCIENAEAMAVTPAGDRAYLLASTFDSVPLVCGETESQTVMGFNFVDRTFFALGNPPSDLGTAIYATDTAVYVATFVSFPSGESQVHRFDGSTWTTVGAALPGRVDAITEFQGTLYLLKQDTEKLMRWNGTAWEALPDQPNLFADVMAADENALYIGGDFSQIGSVPAKHVARFDGSTWSALGAGLDQTVAFEAVEVKAILATSDGVFVTGRFNEAGGQAVNHIARWDGSQWHALGVGLEPPVDPDYPVGNALAHRNGGLYVGGSFEVAGGQAANKIARWDGTQWSGLGTPGINPNPDGTVTGLAAGSTGVLMSGFIASVAGQPAHHVALWTGSAWQTSVGQLGSKALAPASTIVMFQGKAHTHSGNGSLLRLEPSGWVEVVDGNGLGVEGSIGALLSTANGLYVGGFFKQAGGVTVNRVVRWDGSNWHPLGSGNAIGITDPDPWATVRALAYANGVLYVGGLFTEAGGVDADMIASFDGTTWLGLFSNQKSLEGSFFSSAEEIEIIGSDVFVGGSFDQAGGQAVNYIARWDGVAWHPLVEGSRNGTASDVNAMLSLDGELYVASGATFSETPETKARVERWSPQLNTWTALGEGFAGQADQTFSLAVFNDEVYAFGALTEVGDAPLFGAARWNGSAWVGLGAPRITGPNGTIFGAAADATGIYVRGYFSEVDGRPSVGIAKFSPAIFADRFEP